MGAGEGRSIVASDANGEGEFGVEEGAGGGLDVCGGDGAHESGETLKVIVSQAVQFVPTRDVSQRAVALLGAKPGRLPRGAGAVEFIRG